jgi:hypothetical protein
MSNTFEISVQNISACPFACYVGSSLISFPCFLRSKSIHVACPLQTEALAILFSLQRAVHLGMTKIILKTDASVLGRALGSEEMDRGPYGALFRQIRELMQLHFSVYKISVCSRVCNKGLYGFL